MINGREIRIQEAKEKRVEKQNWNNNRGNDRRDYDRGGGGYNRGGGSNYGRDRYNDRNDRGRDNHNNYGRDRRSKSRSPPRRDDYSRDNRKNDDQRR